jgi:hypothetical protein
MFLRVRQRLMRPILEVSGGISEKRNDLKVPLVNKRVRRGSIIYCDPWSGYTGIEAKGYAHRLVEQVKGGFSNTRALI